MIKLTLALFLLTSCNIAGPKYEQPNAKQANENKVHFTDGCKPLLANRFYYWPVDKSQNMFTCSYNGDCEPLDSIGVIIDGDIEIKFNKDMYLCKIL